MADESDIEYHAVCIAKDESAYLHEWIFHHLYFGFDKLHIYLNRITDDSVSIVESISKKYPNVHFEIIDWIDWCQPSVKKNIQDIVYSYHFSKAKKLDCTAYTLYIDADEYWTPIDFKSSIKDEHRSIGMPQMVSYEWLLENGYNKPFVPLGGSLTYRESSFVKTLYKNTLNPKLFSAHKAKIKGGYKGVMANGKRFVALDERRQGRVGPDDAGLKRSFIIHRVMKSEIEYLCSLVRSNPDSDLSIKMNRNGYIGQGQAGDVLEFDSRYIDEYRAGMAKFLEACSLTELVKESRKRYLHQKYTLLKKVYLLDDEYLDKIKKVFKNISDPEIILLMKFLVDKKKKRVDRGRKLFEYLRDIAISVESKDISTAIFFMDEALKLNPNGSLLIKKMKRYKETLHA